MTKAEIDTACECFLKSGLEPEEFFNKYTDEHKTNFGFQESSALITLFYQLKGMDDRILKQIELITER